MTDVELKIKTIIDNSKNLYELFNAIIRENIIVTKDFGDNKGLSRLSKMDTLFTILTDEIGVNTDPFEPYQYLVEEDTTFHGEQLYTDNILSLEAIKIAMMDYLNNHDLSIANSETI